MIGLTRRGARAVVPWVTIPGAGALLAGWALRNSYFFYDEWTVVERALDMPAAAGMFTPFNGHVWIAQYWFYRLQLSWLGVDDHRLVCVLFVGALIALHAAVAVVFRVAGLSRPVALLAGGLITYLGAASQNFVFAIQVSPALATAAGVAATAIVLARPPSAASRAWVGGLMLAAVGFDSGTAVIAVTLAAGAALAAWRRRAWPVVLPAALAVVSALFWGWGDAAPLPAAPGTRLVFGVHLLFRSAGALVGGDEHAGLALVAASIAVLLAGVRWQAIGPRSAALLVAGTTAAGVATTAIAVSRAGDAQLDFVNFNRYLQNVGLPLFIGLLPAWADTCGVLAANAVPPRVRPILAWIGPGLVLAAFLAGVPAMLRYQRMFEEWNLETRRQVQGAAAIVLDGCGPGTPPAAESRPLGALGPQLSTRLLRALLERGLLHPAAAAPDPAVRRRMCS